MTENIPQIVKDLLLLIIPIFVIQIAVVIYAAFDLKKREKVRGSKTLWAILLIFGAISVPTGLIIVAVYLIWGRNVEEYNDQDRELR
jgi:hypothetical protein